MRTKGEIEAAICEVVRQFEENFMGRGPSRIQCHLVEDLILVRLYDVLTPAEQTLVDALPPPKGRILVKEVRVQLMEAAQPTLAALVERCTGVKPVSFHYDLSTRIGEEMLAFTLTEKPRCIDLKTK